MLAMECCSLGVQVRPSLIDHDYAGDGLFANRTFGKGELVGTYYGTVVYTDMTMASQKHRSIGKGFMRVDSETFTKWAMEVTEGEGVVVDGRKRLVFIVPGPHCAMRYINDPRYRKNDRAPKKKRTRIANVAFQLKERDTVTSPSLLVHHGFLEVRTTQDVWKGQEFYGSYGPSFSGFEDENDNE